MFAVSAGAAMGTGVSLLAPSRRGHFVPTAVGILLFLAALAKTHQLLAVGDDPSSLQSVLVGCETVLSLGLVCRITPRLVRFVVALFFVTFLSAAFWAAWQGASACGCAGELKISPWIAVVVDCAVLAALAWWQPAVAPTTFLYASYVGSALLLCASLTALALAVAIASQRTSFPRLEVSPPRIDLGNSHHGDCKAFQFSLHNPHNEAVVVHHVNFSCRCLRAKALPWKVDPGCTITVEAEIDLVQQPSFSGKFVANLQGKTIDQDLAFVQVVSMNVLRADGSARSKD